MTNTLTNMIPTLYEAVDVVSRELVGFIPSVMLDAEASRAAKGQTVRSFVSPAATAEDIVPGTTPPNTGDQTFTTTTIEITKSRAVPFRWTGEEELSMNSPQVGLSRINRDQVAQAIRTLVNEIEADLAALHTSASRSYGTAGTTPFASNLADSAQMLKILLDNGAPKSDLQLVIDTTAGAALRTLAQLTKANEAGANRDMRDIREQGVMINLHGFDIRESAAIKRHTAGTGASATTDNAGYAVGATTITLASAGTGTILAGDTLVFAGDTEKYMVVTGDADVSGGGTVVLAAPGLRKAIPATATAITISASSGRNMAFHRSAIQLAMRAPAVPSGGDLASDRTTIVDPRSGIAFEFAVYPLYHSVRFEVGAAWGVAANKPAHIAVLLG